MINDEPKYRGTCCYCKVYCELIETAIRKDVIHYERIAEIMGITTSGNYMSKEIGVILGEISSQEVSEGRDMISAVVVGKNSGIPGEGFFTLARSLGKLPENENAEKKKKFWEQEIQKVYKYWEKNKYCKCNSR